MSKLVTIKSNEQRQSLLERLEVLYKDKELFDTTLIAGANNVTAKAHRIILSASSDYFLALFRSSLKEGGEVILQNVSGSTLHSILDFIYTARIELSSETVESILRAADVLQMNTLIGICCDFMAEQLEPCNCLGIGLLAEEYGYMELYWKSLGFAYKNFEKVCSEQEFLQQNEKQLNKFLCGDDLHLDSHEKLILSIVAWYKHDEANREKSMVNLLSQHVRHALLEPQFIMETRKKLCNISECSELMCSWLEWHLSTEGSKRQTLKMVFTYRKANDFNFNVQTYSPELNEWSYENWPDPSIQRTDYSMFVTNKKFIITGGRFRGRTTNKVEWLDLQSMKWSELPPMLSAREYHGVTEINGDLYVIGGWKDGKCLYSMEKYDFATKIWQQLTHLPSAIWVKVAVLNGLLYVAGEGQYHLECYNPTTNKWTQTASRKEKLSKFGVAAVNAHLYVVGGENIFNGKSNTVERYDPFDNTWTIMKSLNVGRSHVCCAAWNGRLFACGGWVDDGIRRMFDDYNPRTNEWKSLTPFLRTGGMNSFSAHLSIL